MVGRQLPFFSLIVPFWLIWAFAGFKGMKDIWPADPGDRRLLRRAAVPDLQLHQSLDRRHRRLADLDGLPDRASSRSGSPRSCGCRRRCARATIRSAPCPPGAVSTAPVTTAEMWRGLLPWIIVCVVLLVWGSDWFKVPMNKIFVWNYPVEGLHNLISKVPPVVAKPTPGGRGLRLHLADLHRLRHADRRDPVGVPDGLLAGRGWSRPTARRSGRCATR